MCFITIHSWVSLDRCDENCNTVEYSFDNKIENAKMNQKH